MLTKATVKYIQSLQLKKFREAHKTFAAEGKTLVLDLLKHIPDRVETIILSKGVYDGYAGDWQPFQSQISLAEEFEIQKVSSLKHANGAIAVFKQMHSTAPPAYDGTVLALDGIQDPGNLGTIIRSADWFGVRHIVCSSATVDMYNPKVVQSCMGSMARINVFYTDLFQWLSGRKEKIAIASMDGKDIRQTKLCRDQILVIGNEGNGVSKEILGLGFERVSVAGRGRGAESLNAAVAASILLFAMTGAAAR